MTTRMITALVAATGLLFLTACGGGGGGGSGSPLASAPSTPTVASARTADPGKVQSAGARAAASLPNFGSVTQSSNKGVSGITTDAASASFDGSNLRVTVHRQDGSTLAFNSATDTVADLTSDGQSPLFDHTARDWYLLNYTNTSVSVAYVATSWDNTDPTDYLAGGYWMHLEGDFSAPRITGAEIGAFVDGPELNGTPIMPIQGTASYQGPAAGVYAYEYGSAQGGVPRGSIELGEYDAIATLTADFSARTISGCVGCSGGISVEGVLTAPNGQSADFSATVPARVELGVAPFDSGGTFRSREIDVVRAGATVTSTNGSWGGRFSTIQDAGGSPRLAVGTTGAEWRESDGSQGVFVGAYFVQTN